MSLDDLSYSRKEALLNAERKQATALRLLLSFEDKYGALSANDAPDIADMRAHFVKDYENASNDYAEMKWNTQ